METITTADGKVITDGDRAFNFYDGRWGTVRNIMPSGWFDLRTDDGHTDLLNGERVCVVIPVGNPFHKVWPDGDPKAVVEPQQPCAPLLHTTMNESLQTILALHGRARKFELSFNPNHDTKVITRYQAQQMALDTCLLYVLAISGHLYGLYPHTYAI